MKLVNKLKGTCKIKKIRDKLKYDNEIKSKT